jgi:hypothetical protein
LGRRQGRTTVSLLLRGLKFPNFVANNVGSHIFIRNEIIRILLPDSEIAATENHPSKKQKSLPRSVVDSDSDSDDDAATKYHASAIVDQQYKDKVVNMMESPLDLVSAIGEESEKDLLKYITSVEEVQVYYRDDGRVSLKVDVAMNPHITIREAHKIAGNVVSMSPINVCS